MADEARICDPGGGGLLLPLTDQEQNISKRFRAFSYLAGLGYCFLGVSIVADIFMSSIEAVTSKRRPTKLSCGHTIAVKVWNDTVANLTLMALGSSAPEIMLSVVELLGKEMYSGDLGPSTIVGSAAFNLLVIIAVCVMVIPDGEKRSMKQPAVFLITAAFSVFAYLWLVLILSGTTPDVVTPAEGVITFLFFPILVVLAFLADIGKLPGTGSKDEDKEVNLLRDQLMEQGHELTAGEIKLINHMADDGAKSWAQHRAGATLGAKRGPNCQQLTESEVSVGFLSSSHHLDTDAVEAVVVVQKHGASAATVSVTAECHIHNADGTITQKMHVELPAGSSCGQLTVPVRNEGPKAAGETFSVDLVQALIVKDRIGSILLHSGSDLGSFAGSGAATREKSHIKVNIDKDKSKTVIYIQKPNQIQVGPGQIRFKVGEVSQAASNSEEVVLKLKLERVGGTHGEIKCEYATAADSATADRDFESAKGEVVFPCGAVDQTIDVKLLKRAAWQSKERFFVLLSEIDDEEPVLAQDGSTITVNILPASEQVKAAHRVLRAIDTAVNLDRIEKGNELWLEQFRAAFRPVEGDEDDAIEAGITDWSLHFIALPWKVFFAFIPPTAYCGGWLCFFFALAFIGAVTTVIGDLAAMVGCCLDIPDSITAITIVALGTSLPDAFASKVAAVEDPTADAAIGNVTGSNSVNVFLGLGLPWMTASIYWAVEGSTEEWRQKYPMLVDRYPDGGFVVLAGDLSFSVITFVICCFTAIGVIYYRGQALGAELGGPRAMKVNTSILFVCLWVFYVTLASWKSLEPEATVEGMILAILVGLLIVVASMLFVNVVVRFMNYIHTANRERLKDAATVALVEQSNMYKVEHGLPEMPQGMAELVLKPAVAGDLAEFTVAFRRYVDGLNLAYQALDAVAKKRYDNPPEGAGQYRSDTE